MICNGEYYYDLTKRTGRDVAPSGYGLFVLSCGFSKPLTHDVLTIHPIRRDYQLIYVKEGCLHYKDKKGGDSVVSAGGFLLYEPGAEQHYTLYLADSPEIYWCHFSGDRVPAYLKQYGLLNRQVLNPGQSYEYVQIFTKLKKALHKKQRFYMELCSLFLNELFIIISNKMFTGSVNTPLPESHQNVLRFITDNYYRHLSVDDLADVGLMSTKTLARQFLKYQNTTPLKFLNDFRIERAKELLVNTRLKITEISAAVGFQDEFYFSSVFRKATGVSPVEYRKSFWDK